MNGPIDQLREDLRAHAANDERELATIRGDVKQLIRDTAAQTVTLETIKQSLSRRARTEEVTEVAEVEVKAEKRKAWWKGLLGLLFTAAAAGGGALLHYWAS